MKNETMKTFTVYFKNTHKFDTYRSADPNVYTFVISAMSHEDALRQFKASRRTTVDSKRFTKRFTIVSILTTDKMPGNDFCTCDYCKEHPDMSRKVTVIKTKQPGWMKK